MTVAFLPQYSYRNLKIHWQKLFSFSCKKGSMLLKKQSITLLCTIAHCWIWPIPKKVPVWYKIPLIFHVPKNPCNKNSANSTVCHFEFRFWEINSCNFASKISTPWLPHLYSKEGLTVVHLTGAFFSWLRGERERACKENSWHSCSWRSTRTRQAKKKKRVNKKKLENLEFSGLNDAKYFQSPC